MSNGYGIATSGMNAAAEFYAGVMKGRQKRQQQERQKQFFQILQQQMQQGQVRPKAAMSAGGEMSYSFPFVEPQPFQRDVGRFKEAERVLPTESRERIAGLEAGTVDPFAMPGREQMEATKTLQELTPQFEGREFLQTEKGEYKEVKKAKPEKKKEPKRKYTQGQLVGEARKLAKAKLGEHEMLTASKIKAEMENAKYLLSGGSSETNVINAIGKLKSAKASREDIVEYIRLEGYDPKDFLEYID